MKLQTYKVATACGMPIGKIKTYWADFEKAKPGDKLPVGYRWRRRKGRWLIVSKNGEYDHSAVK